MSKYFQSEPYTDGIYWGSPDFKKITKSPRKIQETIQKAIQRGYEMGLNDGGSSQPQDIIEANVIEKYVEVIYEETKVADQFVDIHVTCVTDITDDVFNEYPNVPIIKINKFDAFPDLQAQSVSFIRNNYSFIGDFEIQPSIQQRCLSFNFGDYSWMYEYQTDGVASNNIKNIIGPVVYYKHYPTGTAAIGGDDSLPVKWSWGSVEVGDIIGSVVIHLSEGDETYPVQVTNYNDNTIVTTAQFGSSTIGTITICGTDSAYSNINFSCPYPVDVILYTDIYNSGEPDGKNLDK